MKMNRIELIELLEEIAKRDLEEGANINDHPCLVAVRAINQAFSDVESLIKVSPKKKGSKRMQMLTGLKYNPEW